MASIIKPATVTSTGFILVAASSIFTAPPILIKIGWLLVLVGSVWFFIKTRG